MQVLFPPQKGGIKTRKRSSTGQPSSGTGDVAMNDADGDSNNSGGGNGTHTVVD
jgi:hypothetical protein